MAKFAKIEVLKKHLQDCSPELRSLVDELIEVHAIKDSALAPFAKNLDLLEDIVRDSGIVQEQNIRNAARAYDMDHMPGGLPAMCYTVIPGEASPNRIAIIQRGDVCYSRTMIDRDGWSDKTVHQVVESLNQDSGLSKYHVEAMVNGLEYGWDTASADPSFLEQASKEARPTLNPKTKKRRK